MHYDYLMCGIIGIKGKGSVDLVRENLQRLQRRGPDSKGTLDLGYELVFGATRLAMTDPHERSNQPMIDVETGNAIVFNGEIYNFRIIRDSLIKNGVAFETESDTEVILKAISFFGVEIVSSFEGMFAFGFFEKRTNRLIIARDYLGKKPLYYHLGNKKFVFSSSSKLISRIITGLKLNYESLNTYLKLGFLVDPNTMYEGIISVKPGQIITIDLNQIIIENSIDYIPKAFTKSNTINLAEVIESALIERVTGHDKFAISLSGGVDSSLLALICAKLNLDATAYTLNWPYSDKSRYNEDATNAKKIASSLGLKIQTIDFPSADKIPSILDEYIMAMDEPNSNATGLSMMYLYSQISKDSHRLVLTGDGADEIFGGYERYKITDKFRNYPNFSGEFIKKMINQKGSTFPFLYKSASIFSSMDSVESWQYWQQITGAKTIKKIYPDLPNFQFSILGNELTSIFQENNKVANLMFRDLRTWLSMESNQKLDRISMWYSIEARSPFQSENVISIGYKKMKGHGFKRLSKELLFEAFPKLNSLSMNQNKSGFISPLGYWLRKNPEFINSSLSNLCKNFNFKKYEIDKLSKSPEQGNFENFKLLWSLIVFERWFTLST